MTSNISTSLTYQGATYSPRVRHLKSILIRNLSYKPADVTSLVVYFTLHRNKDSPEFYISTLVPNSLNPSWEQFDLHHLPCYYTASNNVVLRLWIKEAHEAAKIHLEYILDLRMLIPTAFSQSAHSGHSLLSSRSDLVTLCMFDMTYEIPNTDSCIATESLVLASSGVQERTSYTFNLLRRLQVVLRALKQTEKSVDNVRRDIERHLVQIETVNKKKEEIESYRVRNNELQDKCEHTRLLSQEMKSRLHDKKTETRHLEKAMSAHELMLRDDDSQLTVQKSDHIRTREKLLKAHAMLAQRHRQMIHELSIIYPIEEVKAEQYMISGVILLPSDALPSQDEVGMSTALGHSAHLVSMLSRFLNIPLQFPIEYRGSRSLIYDLTRPAVIGNQARLNEFPLYSRGKDKQQFRYAVFLLNKNIANIRHYFGMHTKDLRLTLRNLKEFLHIKFGIGLNALQPSELLNTPKTVYRTASNPTIPSNKFVPTMSNGGLSDSGMGQVIDSEDSREETTHPKPQFYTPDTIGDDNYNSNNNSDQDQVSREDDSQEGYTDNKRDSAMTLQESESDSEFEKTCCINPD